MSNQDLFSEFPPVSKADWLRQITKDLKDKPLADLNWQLSDGLVVTPFVHADDFETPPAPLADQPNPWEICEDVLVSDPMDANRQALDALEGGAESLCFWLEKPLEAVDFGQLLQDIHLDFIGLHFAGKAIAQNPGMVLGNLENLARQRGLSTTQLRGSLAYDPVPVSKIVDWLYLSDLLKYAQEKFPQFKIIQVSSPELRSGDIMADAGSSPERSSGVLIRNANIYLLKLSERGIPVKDIANAMQFSVPVGTSYFVEIARMRALKLLWFNVLKAWNAPLQSPAIAAHFQPSAYSDELYTNMIRATTMAMSAVQGGASRLTVLPYDAGREAQARYPQAFSRRIARNVQHLLKMESALDEVVDPAAGSYYVETLTRQLAEQAWEGMEHG
ncbi:MAG: methylmalonyl-CoA mutase family protein [Saprospiraceae bacterium]|nr:methylmalonyl-CoA mutase family protein [Saprospiraceae bacterium]